MNIKEFTDRTKIHPSIQMYKFIEEEYTKSDKDKDQFCADFLNDVDGVATKVQSQCNSLEINNDDWHDLPVVSAITRQEYSSRVRKINYCTEDGEVKSFINSMFGFDKSLIKIVRKINVIKVNYQIESYQYSAGYVYCDPIINDYYNNYVRFTVMNQLFEIVDGKLYKYFDMFFSEI